MCIFIYIYIFVFDICVYKNIHFLFDICIVVASQPKDKGILKRCKFSLVHP